MTRTQLADRAWSALGRRMTPPPERVLEGRGLHPGGVIDVDACIVTNCMSNGGNAVSTLAEYRAFREAGMSVLIVHCSIRSSPWKRNWIFEGYAPHAADLVPSHRIERLACRAAVVRAPRAIAGRAFADLAPRMAPDKAILVVNNAAVNEEGRRGFDWPKLHARAAALPWPDVELCPTGPLIRAESGRFMARSGVPDVMSPRDWPPAFDERAYVFAPRPHWDSAVVIGRHARDHPGKWLEDPGALLSAYPEGDPDIRVRILGGAETVEAMLGRIPEGWEVLPFGLGGVTDYLSSLDAFVYFPSPERHEAFGRTIVEAILSGLPAILPPRFEATFGDLGLYCAPSEVRGLIGRLADDDAGRLAHLAACRDLAASLYGTPSLVRRLSDGAGIDRPRLSAERAAWRARLLDGYAGAPSP